MHCKLHQAMQISVLLRSDKDRSRRGHEGSEVSTGIVLNSLEPGR